MIRDPALAVAAHAIFEYAGIALGLVAYRRNTASLGAGGLMAPGRFAIVAGLLAGAAIGNKLVYVIERPEVWQQWLDGRLVMPGQSIVGGLLGGLIGVEIAKALTRQPRSTGDAMVWPIAMGLVLGRIGCFLAGLHDDTYGEATAWPWGVDLGDGVPRHPTALYDIAAVLALAWATAGRFDVVPGLAFKLFLAGYLAWRWAIDGLKPVPHAYALGWSGIQWVCAAALLVYLPLVRRAWRQRAIDS